VYQGKSAEEFQARPSVRIVSETSDPDPEPQFIPILVGNKALNNGLEGLSGWLDIECFQQRTCLCRSEMDTPLIGPSAGE